MAWRPGDGLAMGWRWAGDGPPSGGDDEEVGEIGAGEERPFGPPNPPPPLRRKESEATKKSERPQDEREITHHQRRLRPHARDDGGDAEHGENIVDVGADEVADGESVMTCARSGDGCGKLGEARSECDDGEPDNNLAHAKSTRDRRRTAH